MESSPIKPRRSLLFVPGNRLNLFSKAIKAEPDIICIDLEDSIPTEQKARTRTEVLEFFQTIPAHPKIEVVMRINSLQTHEGIQDIDGIMATSHPPLSVMVTKLDNAEEITLLDKLLSNTLLKKIRFHVIIETNSGLENVVSIANSSDRIDCLLFGGVDMAAELRCKNTWGSLLYARSRLVHAAASAGIDVIDVPYLDLDDLDGMKEAAELARDLGFSGKGAVHPKQIPALNAVFTPDAEAIKTARHIIKTFEEAETGLVVIDGKLIEKPVLREMHRIVAIAGKIS